MSDLDLICATSPFLQMLYTSPGIGQYLSGAIMFHETLFQSTSDGTPFVKVGNRSRYYRSL